jgi:lysozyme
MKATEGSSYVDPNRARNYINATKAGIKCCTYHWLKPGNARKQIEFYLKMVDPVPGERMVIDYEENGCTLADLKEAVQALKDDPRDLQITVYSGHLLKQQLGNTRDAFLADNTDLWLAQYTTGLPTWPRSTYPQWTLWQYSETGTIDGITGSKVDLDHFNGSVQELLDWISPAAAAPVKPPAPIEPEAAVAVPISIALTVPDHVALSLTVNGKVIMKEAPL